MQYMIYNENSTSLNQISWLSRNLQDTNKKKPQKIFFAAINMWLNSGTETNYFPIKNFEKPLRSVNSCVEMYAKYSQRENGGIN